MKKIFFSLFCQIIVLFFISQTAFAQTTEFTYQGQLQTSGASANGTYDFEFALFDSSGTQIGANFPASSVTVSNGSFSVRLDFGEQFPGTDRYLEIRVRQTGGGSFTTLTPRQKITSAPYGIKAKTAETANTATTANNATSLGGIAANQYVLTGDARLTDERNPLPNSTNYIQNTTTQQSSSNFNISGNGIIGGNFGIGTTAPLDRFHLSGLDVIRARINSNSNAGVLLSLSEQPRWSLATVNDGQFQIFNEINRQNALWINSANNFIGIGTITPTERLHIIGNGLFSGNLTVNGTLNATLPSGSGSYIQNTTNQQSSSNFNISGTGTANIFNAATQFNIGGNRILSIAGTENLFVGLATGPIVTTGSGNSFFGRTAGSNTTSGNNNSFFGRSAGVNNSTGGDNSFVGNTSGFGNTSGSGNTFFGSSAGNINSTGSRNTIIGAYANVGFTNLTNANAIGYRAYVTRSNSLVLGSINGENDADADTNVGIGTTAPLAKLHLSGVGVTRARINSNDNAGVTLALGEQHKWSLATVNDGQFQIFNEINRQNALWINSANNFIGIGTINPTERLHVEGNGVLNGSLDINGTIRFAALGVAGSTQLCRNVFNQLAACSSSMRYKTNVNAFTPGLNLIKQLRPVSFNWTNGGMLDLGLVAEEVAKVEPLLTTTNEKGETEGVKYDRVGVVLVNAVQEQQTQIEAQQKQIDEQKEIIRQQEENLKRQQSEIEKQKAELDALKKLVCSQNPAAELCRPQN